MPRVGMFVIESCRGRMKLDRDIEGRDEVVERCSRDDDDRDKSDDEEAMLACTASLTA